MSMGEDDDLNGVAPLISPAYASDELRELGDELARLYDQRERDPVQAASLAPEIARVRGQMRKGPRLQAGEFLADGRYRLVERLARGGVDGFWKAWDREVRDFVLVRVFHGTWVAEPEAIQQFLTRGGQLMVNSGSTTARAGRR